jgi:CubicO group peptidase (beta-lactamase class C family)
MTSAGFGPPGSPGRIDQPWGHVEENGKAVPEQHDNAPALGPAGTVHVSIPDWARFALLHLRGDRGGAPLLEPATFRRLHSAPAGSDYAAGWGVSDPRGPGRALTHAGSNTMWFATILVAPVRDFAILTATNQGGDAAAKACEEAERGLIGWTPAGPGLRNS